MKYFLLFLLCTITFSSFSQKTKATESDEKIGGNKNPALVISIYDVAVDEVGSRWKSLMKDYKAKVSTKDEVFADNAIIAAINGNNTIDIYAKIEKVSDAETRLIVAFDLGGAFLNSSNKDKFNAAKKIINDFSIKTSKDAIAGKRKIEERKFSDLKDQQHDLEKKQEKLASSSEDYKQKIEEYKQKIKEAEDNIAKNKVDLEKKKQELDAQKKVVDAIAAKEKAVE